MNISKRHRGDALLLFAEEDYLMAAEYDDDQIATLMGHTLQMLRRLADRENKMALARANTEVGRIFAETMRDEPSR